jgi:DNA ligase-1
MEPLYENNKIWSIFYSVNKDGSYTIRTEHGQINGKMITHESIVKEGKNKGKKNETSIEEQTILEVKRDWDKKRKQGYRTIQDMNTITNTNDNTNTNPENTIIIKPMLAMEFKNSVKYPIWIQPKLDGVRCLIYLKGDNIVFQSRQNTIYEPFTHLLPELKVLLSLMPENTILDGELYTHGLGFETITSMVRRSKTRHPDLHKLKYCLYDFKSEKDILYKERMETLNKAYNNHNFECVNLIETKIAKDAKDIESLHDYYTKQGYEGIMLRNNAIYKDGRTKDLLKYKKFFDAEFKVVGHHEGNGGIPIFDCEVGDKTFGVAMKGDMGSRKERMDHVTDYYGKMLTVKYQELSLDGIPRFPVGICFRDYE